MNDSMISLRQFVQLYLEVMYPTTFGSTNTAVAPPPISEAVTDVVRIASASGYIDNDVGTGVLDRSTIQLFDSFSNRVIFAHRAKDFISSGDRTYYAPDLPTGSGVKQVPTGIILPSLAELARLLSVPVRWVDIELPKLEGS